MRSSLLADELAITSPWVEPSRRQPPPSGTAARVWTLLAAFWLWLLLPVAIYFQRKARREAEASTACYEWRRTIWNRPVLLWLIVLAAALILIFAMAALGFYGDPAHG